MSLQHNWDSSSKAVNGDKIGYLREVLVKDQFEEIIRFIEKSDEKNLTSAGFSDNLKRFLGLFEGEYFVGLEEVTIAYCLGLEGKIIDRAYQLDLKKSPDDAALWKARMALDVMRTFAETQAHRILVAPLETMVFSAVAYRERFNQQRVLNKNLKMNAYEPS